MTCFINLGLNKGRGRFLNFSDTPPSRKKIVFTCLAQNVNRTSLDYVIKVYLVKIILLLIGQGSTPLLTVGWTYLLILRQHI